MDRSQNRVIPFVGRTGINRSGNAKIGHFDSSRFCHQDIVRFDITVDNSVRMGMLQCFTNVEGNLD